jgi:hypothetical protein
MITRSTIVEANPSGGAFAKAGAEAVLMGLDSGRYYSLNEVGTRFWEIIQRPISIGEAAAVICAEFEVSIEQAEADLSELAGQLIDAGLARQHPDGA